jgi:K+-sensing histidine kinase KdpD
MLGNLMENTFRWAVSKVDVSAGNDDKGNVVVFVDDDGPGLSELDLSKALQLGQRLDESTPGLALVCRLHVSSRSFMADRSILLARRGRLVCRCQVRR